jgi:mannose-1-phosphate guanylyltransferase/mannose-1-phosphate guanylyltransferase/mannose-6-phosphate isomerase
MSRELYPKQLLPLTSEASLLQETAKRVADSRFAPPLIVCNDAHRFIIAEQLRALGVKPQGILLEPVARNTGPAVAAAALMLAESAPPETLMLVLASDHVVRNQDAFLRAVDTAAIVARRGRLVCLGIKPTQVETGYGYIRRGADLDGVPGAFAVDRFVEKPDAETAQRYLDEGTWSWNASMFMFPIGLFTAELAHFEPEMAAAVRDAVAKGARDLDFVRLENDSFAKATSKSVDYAVMERTDKAAVVPADLGWSDVGAWSALWDLGAKDAAGNVKVGDVIEHGTKNSYLRSDKVLLAAVGLDNTVVVAMPDVVLVADMDEVQNVKKIVDQLKQKNRSEAVSHPVVYRPWGSYQTIDAGPRFQVKRITVKPGQKLSLQKHAQRAEHWVVVSGTARVTRNQDLLTLTENMSTYIPLGAVHRLENPGAEMLHVIEVQSGGYLGEDDIVRIDDVYGRS